MILTDINWTICRRVLWFLSITFFPTPRKVLRGPTTVNGAFRAFTEIHSEVIWWPHAKLSAAIPSSASSLSCPFEYQTPFITLLYTIRYQNGHLHYGCFRIFTSEDGWVANGQKGPRGWWRERTARSSTWKDSTNLFALSATARLKGSSSRSLVKSATYPMILSSVEVIHDRERQTKYSFPITHSICFFKFVNSVMCNVE